MLREFSPGGKTESSRTGKGSSARGTEGWASRDTLGNIAPFSKALLHLPLTLFSVSISPSSHPQIIQILLPLGLSRNTSAQMSR